MHENSYFLFEIISKFTQKRINRKCFQKISSRELPHSKRVSEIFIFYLKNGSFLKNIYIKKWQLKKNYIKNDTFLNLLKSKFDPNTHQIAMLPRTP